MRGEMIVVHGLDLDARDIKEGARRLDGGHQSGGKTYALGVARLAKIAGVEQIQVHNAAKGRNVSFKTVFRLRMALETLGVRAWPGDLPKSATCGACARGLPLDRFPVLESNGSTTLSGYCVACVGAAASDNGHEEGEETELAIKARENLQAHDGVKLCAWCGATRGENEYWADRNAPDGYYYYCKTTCGTKKQRETTPKGAFAGQTIVANAIAAHTAQARSGTEEVYTDAASATQDAVQADAAVATEPLDEVEQAFEENVAEMAEAPEPEPQYPARVMGLALEVARIICDRIEVTAREESSQWEALSTEYEAETTRLKARVAELEQEVAEQKARLSIFDGISPEMVEAMRMFRQAFRG